MSLQKILKEQEAEFAFWAKKVNFEKYYKISRFQDFIQSYNAKIIKAVCEEMIGKKKEDKINEEKHPRIEHWNSGYNARVQEEQEKAQELIKETL